MWSLFAAEFADLAGQPITIAQTVRDHNLNRKTVLEWVKRDLIKVLKPGYRMQLEKADVCYCAEIYHQKFREYDGKLQSVPIFDRDGNFYSVMHPTLSKLRRQHS